MKEFIEFIARRLVDKPDSVRVEVNKIGDRTSFILFVDEIDLGKVIGKGGKTAKSIRTLLTAIAAKDDKKIALIIPNEKSKSKLEEKAVNSYKD